LNAEIHKQIVKVKADVIESVKKEHVGRFFRFINPVDADEAIERVLSETMSHLQGTLTKRSEVKVPLPEKETSANSRLCQRSLRVQVKDGETYIIKDWTNAVFARKYDSAKKCDTVYSAQCATGTIFKTKQCPFSDPVVTKTCLRGASWRCWKRTFVVKAASTKVIAVPQPDDTELPLLGAELTVDAPAPQIKTRTMDHLDISADETVGTKVLSGKDLHGADSLDEELEMTVPGFQETLSTEMCKNSGNHARFGFTKAIRKFTCRTMFNGISHFARWSGTYKIADLDRMSMKLDMRENLTAAVVPSWEVVERKAETEVVNALAKQTLPLNAKLSKVRVSIGGEGHTLKVKPDTAAWVDAEIDMSILGQLGNLGNLGNLGGILGGLR